MYINRPDPIVFLPDTVDNTGRLYDDFSRLLFQHPNREASVNEIPEELICHLDLLYHYRVLFVSFVRDVLFHF